MEKGRILVAEDDPITGEYLKKVLESDGYQVTLVEDGQKALKEFHKNPYRIVLVDMKMPVLGGKEITEELRTLEKPPIVIVESSESGSDTIIEMMQKGAQDYLIKPVTKDDLIFKVRRALEMADLRDAKRALERERQMRLEKQLDWNIMKERIAARSYDRFDKTLFSSLKASFNQGAGIGALVTILSLVKNQLEKKEGFYLVREDMMDMIFHNAIMAKKALDAITEISDMLDQEFETETISVQGFYDSLLSLKDEMADVAAIRGHSIKFNDVNYNQVERHLEVNTHYMKKAFYELLLNALKFSVPQSVIYVFTNCGQDRFYISIMNEASENITGTAEIPKDYEKLIFEPFFRLVKYVYEEYGSLDFGLGLTMVEKVIRKHMGRITLSTVKDNSDLEISGKSQKVNFEVDLPLV